MMTYVVVEYMAGWRAHDVVVIVVMIVYVSLFSYLSFDCINVDMSCVALFCYVLVGITGL